MKRLRSLLLSVIIPFIFSIPTALLRAAQPESTTYTTMDTVGFRVEPKWNKVLLEIKTRDSVRR